VENGRHWGKGKVSDEEELRRCVALMLDAGIDVDVKDEDGQTPLFLASTWSATLVELLLEAGADATTEFPGGDSCLHTTSDAKTAQLLVEKGRADINKKRHSDGQTALLGAIAAQRYPLAKKLVALGADLTATDADGRGPLHLLVASLESYATGPCESTLETLLAAGVSPDARDHAGRTPLHGLETLFPSQEKFVRMLVEAGADVNARDNMGHPLLFNFAKSARRRKDDHDFTPEVLQTLLDLGVRLDVVDHEGRDVLFWHFELENVHLELANALVLAGADPHARDLAGNTLWHNTFKYGPNPLGKSDVDALKQLNVDVEARNHAGQSALHIIAARGPKNLALGLELFSAAVDTKDNDGIRPLHIACRDSEESVAMLLAAGASPTESTYEGITPLHVAARFRQPNITGMLLEKIRESHDPQALAAHLNAARRQEPSALHLACRSGCPETVALLLAAGADPNLQDRSRDKSTPLRWIAQYEDEEALWRVKEEVSWTSFGVKIADSRRESQGESPRLPGLGSTGQHVGRVEDILDLLHSHGAKLVLHKEKSKGTVLGGDERTELDKAIEDSLGKDYTTACLVNFWHRLITSQAEGPDGDDGKLEPASYVRSASHGNLRLRYPILASLNRREASLEAFKETKPWEKRHAHRISMYGSWGPYNAWSLEGLIKDHQWDSIRHWFENDPDCFSHVSYNKDTEIADLVWSGHDSLVGDVLTPERLAEHEEKLKALSKSDRERTSPLLQTACSRKHGNIPMLRCLVEKIGVDVNEQKQGTEYVDGGEKPVDDDSALHVLAAGSHWWQAAEGLPYLISKGASLELRAKGGRTPLLRALERGGYTGRRAARVLVEAGADVNAVDNSGRSCLAVAGSDTELVKLLLDRGAEVTASAIFSAITEGNAELLDTLLQRASPDARLPPQTTNKAQRRNRDSLVDDHEMYPLYYASLHVPNRFKEKRAYAYDTSLTKGEVLRQHLPCIEALVRRGADPFVTYTRGRVAKGNIFKSDEYVDEEATLLHDLLEEGGLVRPILENVRDIDLERRDARGRTPLLAACRSQIGTDYSIDAVRVRSLGWMKRVLDEDRAPDTPSAVELFLSKGASAAVQDYEKKNALHHILKSRSGGGANAMRRLLECAPALVHQVDDAGETPLHYALRRHDSWNRLSIETIELLIGAAADVTIPDKDGNTALHRLGLWLADKPSEEADGLPYHPLFQLCLSQGVPINSRNQKGETPLFSFIAAQGEGRSRSYDPGDHKRQKATLDMLFDAGADVLTTNNEGDTLLHVVASTDENRRRADSEGQEESGKVMVERFQWLMERGLDPMRENLRSQTSLDVAALNSNTMILDLF
jgi:ankyrin repeat protein